MTDKLPQPLIRAIADLETRIQAATPRGRAELQGDLRRLCEKLELGGYEIPERLGNLDAMLTDAAIEAQFDNLPV